MAGSGVLPSGTNSSPTIEQAVDRPGPVWTVKCSIVAWKPLPVAPGDDEVTFAGGGGTNEVARRPGEPAAAAPAPVVGRNAAVQASAPPSARVPVSRRSRLWVTSRERPAVARLARPDATRGQLTRSWSPAGASPSPKLCLQVHQ